MNTGQHDARRAAAAAVPSPITALRDMLATAFAADIAAVTPEVCDVLREGIPATATPARRDLILAAHGIVMRDSGALSLGIAQRVRARFDARLRLAVDSPTAHCRAPLSDLALLDEALLETDLAVNHCAARLKEQASEEIFQLTSRVAAMLDQTSLDEPANPIAPRLFVCALVDALGKTGLGDEQRLAVFKAFGPPLLHIAPDLYNHANQLLAERGVLVDFNARYGRPTIIPSAAPLRGGDDEQALAALLERLLSGERARGGGSAAGRPAYAGL